MASLGSLSIKGIRAFHPKPPDPSHASISFDGPVTLISGENGSGKTTIIECLNYATMGKFSERTPQREMISDPGIWETSQVDAEVRLEFTSETGEQTAVTRCASATLTTTRTAGLGSKGSSCGLEVCVDGEWRRVSVTQADLNVDIPRRLGVSAALLEHVLFCHQEDSCWPIDENKEGLKKRFDAIFGAERYDKATAALKAFRKELKEKKQSYEKKVAVADERLRTRLQVESDAEATREEINRDTVKRDEAEALRQDANLRVAEFERVKGMLDGLAISIETSQRAANFHRDRMKEIEKDVGSEHPDVDVCRAEKERLELEQAEVQGEVGRIEQELREAQRQQRDLQNEIEKLRNEERRIQNDIQNADADRRAYDQKLEEFRNLYGSGEVQQVSEEKQAVVSRLRGEQQEVTREGKEAVTAQQKQLKEWNEKRTAIATEFKREKSEEEAREKELQQFGLFEVTNERVEQARKRYNEAAQQVEALTSSKRNSAALQAETKTIEAEQDRINQDYAEVVEQQNRAKRQSDLDRQLSLVRYEITRAENQQAGWLTEIQHVVGAVTVSNFADVWRAELERLGKMIKEHKAGELNLSVEIAQLSRELAKEQEDVEDRTKRIRKAEKKFQPLLQGDDFDEVLQLKKQRLAENAHELNVLAPSEPVFSDFLKQAREHARCPLCGQDFASGDKHRAFIESLEAHIAKLPGNRDRLQKEQSRLEKEIKVFDDSRQEYLEYQNRIKEAPVAEQRIRDLQGRLQARGEALEFQSQTLGEAGAREKGLLSLKGTVDQLTESLEAVRSARAREADLSRQRDPSVPSEAQIVSQIAQIQQRRSELADRHKRITDERIALSRHESEARDLMGQALHALREIEQQFDRKTRLIGQRDTAATTAKQLEKQKGATEIQVNKMETELSALEHKLEQRLTELRHEIDEAQAAAARCTGLADEILRLGGSLTSVDSGRRQTELDNCRQVLRTKEAARVTAENAYSAQDERLNELRTRTLPQVVAGLSALADHLNYWREFGEYRQAAGEADSKAQERRELLERHRIGTMDEKELRESQKKYDNECTTLRTRLNIHTEKLCKLTQELDESRGVPRMMTSATVKLQAVAMSISDVDKYIGALEQSLLDYHTQKMEEINESIHSLWQSIYRGNDIESISIKAVPGPRQGARYDYRVTMRKDGIDLNMAHRCSAGQKMVASLIIRLALAQTLAVNCGILALDEPTTNLDVFNVDNLSLAINRLVEERQAPQAKPFQLIIISHSNHFVGKLLKGGSIDHFYQIRRDTDRSRHYSAIYRCDSQYLELEGS
jgi:DNA repair protein RAD50